VRALKETGVGKAEHDAHNEAVLKRHLVLQAAWRGSGAGAPTDAETFAAAWPKAAKLPVIFGN
jgi:hypothetical protein